MFEALFIYIYFKFMFVKHCNCYTVNISSVRCLLGNLLSVQVGFVDVYLLTVLCYYGHFDLAH